MSGRPFPNVLFVFCGRNWRFGDSVRVVCSVTGVSSLAAKTNPRGDSWHKCKCKGCFLEPFFWTWLLDTKTWVLWDRGDLSCWCNTDLSVSNLLTCSLCFVLIKSLVLTFKDWYGKNVKTLIFSCMLPAIDISGLNARRPASKIFCCWFLLTWRALGTDGPSLLMVRLQRSPTASEECEEKKLLSLSRCFHFNSHPLALFG